MAEIKTWEQYGLMLLANTEKKVELIENKNAELAQQINDLNKVIENFKELLNILGIRVRDCTTCDAAMVDVTPVYSWDKDYARAKALYDSLMKVCDLPDHDGDKAPEIIDAEVVSK